MPRIQYKYSFISFLFMALSTLTSCAQMQTILPDHSAFGYSGRFDQTNPEAIRFDWSATSIRFGLNGSEFTLLLQGGDRNYFNLFINDSLHAVLHLPGEGNITINGLQTDHPNKVLIQKRTEGEMGTAVFKGIRVPQGTEVFPLALPTNRRIGFLGNSITCGYGTEGASRTERFKPETENANQSYAMITARAFQAEAHLVAHSGMGVIRNYGDSLQASVSRSPMPVRFEQTLDMEPELKWDFGQWIPDVFVINLGTNDYSTQPHPVKEDFQNTYLQLLARIRKVYPGTPVVVITGPLMAEPANEHIAEVVEKFNAEQQTALVSLLGLPRDLLNEERDFGSDAHPSYQGQRKIAQKLIQHIGTLMGWEVTTSEMQ